MFWNFSNRYRDALGNGLVDHVYVDGGCPTRLGGDDTLGDGTIGNPFKSYSAAKAIMVLGGNMVFAPSEMLNQFGSSANYEIIGFSVSGDTKNNDVVFIDTVGDKKGLSNFNSINNITIKGYLIPILPVIFGNTNDSKVNNVVIQDCGSFVAKAKFTECTFINTNIDSSNASFLVNINQCKFYNVVFFNKTIQIADLIINRCYFDDLSSYVYSAGIGGHRYTDCFFYNESTYFGTESNYTQIGTIDGGGAINVAKFVSPSFIDNAVSIDSPLLINDGDNIGNVFRGLSFSPDQPDFVATVNANPDVEIVNAEIALTASVPVGEFRTVEGFEITASGIGRLSTPFQIGVSSKCEYEFEVRVADVANDISMAIWGAWKAYRLGEPMTNNSDGTPTGDINYNWLDNNPVNYKFAQGRLKITKIA